MKSISDEYQNSLQNIACLYRSVATAVCIGVKAKSSKIRVEEDVVCIAQHFYPVPVPGEWSASINGNASFYNPKIILIYAMQLFRNIPGTQSAYSITFSTRYMKAI